jgi:hypothetical protein
VALAIFKNKKTGSDWIFHFIIELAESDCFAAEFISEGGLAILSALPLPHLDCSYPNCVAVNNPMQALFAVTKGDSFIDTLPIDSLRELLRSPIISQEMGPLHATPDTFCVIQKIQDRISALNDYNEAFPEAASTWAQILNQALIDQQLDPKYWEHTGAFSFEIGKFKQFYRHIRTMINKLRGIKEGNINLP